MQVYIIIYNVNINKLSLCITLKHDSIISIILQVTHVNEIDVSPRSFLFAI